MADHDAIATHYRTVQASGLEIFYREAGPRDAPTILLLHGFPTSSHMFRDLIPRLADRYHLVAPDYPGFGNSACPSVDAFSYTFDHLADVLEAFTEGIGLERYALYLQDFGGPVGFRLATRHPERVTALVIQNANAYAEGVTDELRAILLRRAVERAPPPPRASHIVQPPLTARRRQGGYRGGLAGRMFLASVQTRQEGAERWTSNEAARTRRRRHRRTTSLESSASVPCSNRTRPRAWAARTSPSNLARAATGTRIPSDRRESHGGTVQRVGVGTGRDLDSSERERARRAARDAGPMNEEKRP